MVSGLNLDVLRKSGKYPCGVCQAGVVEMLFSVEAAGNGYTRNAVA